MIKGRFYQPPLSGRFSYLGVCIVERKNLALRKN
jgi:hypothetical protein